MPGRPFRAAALALALVALPAVGRPAAAQWVADSSHTSNELRGLSVVSPRVVWASGTHGTVLRTVDGGATWTAMRVPGADSLDLRAIAGTSARVAHAMSVGDSSKIFRTTDGGRSWSLRFTSTKKGSFLDAIRFWDARHGIAMSDPVDGHFLVFTTDDGGESWQEVPSSGIPPALAGEGAFAASGSCLAVWGARDAWMVSGGASVARIYHSSDRGRTWSVHDTPVRAGAASAGIFSVAFRDRAHGVIAGGDYQKARLGGRNLAVTNDGGMTWTPADSATSPAGYRSAVAHVPASKGQVLVAVGLSGTDVSRDGGKTWTPRDTMPLNSVAFATRAKGWAVGPKGRVLHWASPSRMRATRASSGVMR